jgi:hypothetical protein
MVYSRAFRPVPPAKTPAASLQSFIIGALTKRDNLLVAAENDGADTGENPP